MWYTDPFLLLFLYILLDMMSLLNLLFHKVLVLVLSLGPYIFLTCILLYHYIVHLKCIWHSFCPKGSDVYRIYPIYISDMGHFGTCPNILCPKMSQPIVMYIKHVYHILIKHETCP